MTFTNDSHEPVDVAKELNQIEYWMEQFGDYLNESVFELEQAEEQKTRTSQELKDDVIQLIDRLFKYEKDLPSLRYKAYQLVMEFLPPGKEQQWGLKCLSRIRRAVTKFLNDSANIREALARVYL
jgi:hypothetical protein